MKYTLTANKKEIEGGITLTQVLYEDGVLGGWIEKESNLSQYGNCRILNNAMVFGNAQVYGYAQVYGNAQVYGKARVYGSAQVYGYARIYGNAQVFGDARVYGNAIITNYGDIIHVSMFPYTITITPQNIVIGCQLRERFGKNQWTSKDKDATPELIKKYAPVLKFLKNMVPRKRT